MNNKGLINEIWIVVVMFIVFIGLIGLFWLVATAGPLVVGEGKQLTGILQTNIHATNPGTALDNATIVATNTADSFLGMVEVMVYLMFLGFMLGYVAVCYYVRTFKWLAVVWIVLMIGAVFMSMIVSNAYEQAKLSSADMSSFYTTWGTNNFIMGNLPYIVGVIGLMSGVILFVIISVGTDEETKEIG